MKIGKLVKLAAENTGVVEKDGAADAPVKLPKILLAAAGDKVNVGVVVGVATVKSGVNPETLVTVPLPPLPPIAPHVPP